MRTGISHFYSGFNVSKGISIICPERGGGYRVTSDVIVRQIPSGERLVLKRYVGFGASSLVIENNTGTVFVEKCQTGLQGGELIIKQSSAVAVNEVYGLGARIESSYVTFNRCFNGSGLAPDPLLRVNNSIVVFGNSILLGSRANYNLALCQVVSPPGDAIAGYDSLLVLGAGTTLIGGRLNVSGGSCPPVSMEAAAIRGSNVRVIRDPTATLGIVTGTVTVQNAPQPTLDGVVGDELAGRMDFDLWAASGSAAALVASLPTEPVNSVFGFQWANLAAHVVPDVGVTDATGHRKVSFNFPTAYPLGQPMVFQSLVLGPTGPQWSTPSAIVKN